MDNQFIDTVGLTLMAFLVFLISVYGLLSVPVESLMWKPSILQFICLSLLQMAYAQSSNNNHDQWAYSSFDNCCLPELQTVDVDPDGINGGCLHNCHKHLYQRKHDTLVSHVLCIKWQCHIRFSTILCVSIASSADAYWTTCWLV